MTGSPGAGRRPRVLVATWRANPVGGVPTLVRSLATHVDPERVELHLCTVRPETDEDDLGALVALAGLHPLDHTGPSPPGRRGQLAIAARFGALVRRLRPDVVHLHGGTTWMGALQAVGVPPVGRVVVEVHDAPASGLMSGATARLEGWMVRRPRCEPVANSGFVADELERHHGLPAGSVAVVPLSVPPVASPRRPPPDGDVVRVVTVASRLAPVKNVGLLLDVAERVAARNRRVRFVVVGDGAGRADLERRRDERGLADVVGFAGRVPDVGAVLAGADIALSTSDYEGFGLFVVEAMAAGLPMVATEVGVVPDLVRDHDAVLAAAVGDAEGLAAAVADLAGDPARRATMAERSRRAAAALGGPTDMARRYEALWGAGAAPPERGRTGRARR